MTHEVRAELARVDPDQRGHIAPDRSIKKWLQSWLAKNNAVGALRWLLAHADDGVVWGRVENRTLITSHDVTGEHSRARKVCPPLRSETLQQARLFSEAGELLLWRSGECRFSYRLITDTEDENTAHWRRAYDEHQMLWGTHGTPLSDGFTLLRHGAEGLAHAFPRPLVVHPNEEIKPPRLTVRHYLNREGPARVVASRLVNISGQS